ncbi:DUF6350 family protein [Corynebacterium sp. H128]|uniref:cell division protein PerM n=1 Tax=Corynebacterium sp. H128 TaxID=3133427 RepID=UPI0030B60B48
MIIVSLVVVMAIAAILVSSSSFVALPATVAQLWLVANAAPVASKGTELGYVPLLPACFLIAVIAWRVYAVVKDKVSLADLYVLAGCVLGVPFLLTLTASAMLLDAGSVYPVAVASVPGMLGRTVLVHLLALLIGMGPRLWRALERRYAPDADLFDTAVLALKYWAGLLVAAGLIFLALLVAHWSTAADLYRSMSQPGAALGLSGLSLLYLPNVLLGVVFVLTGGEFTLGEGALSLFGAYLVPLPPLPILAAIPGHVWPYAWALLVLPLFIAAFVSYRHLRSARRPFRTVGLAGLWSAGISLIAWIFASGTLGGYGFIGPVWWMALLSVPLWLWGAGALIAGVGWLLDSRMPELADDDLNAATVVADDAEESSESEAADDSEQDAVADMHLTRVVPDDAPSEAEAAVEEVGDDPAVEAETETELQAEEKAQPDET